MGALDRGLHAKTVRKGNRSPVQIVFSYRLLGYIAEGYEVAALHYLMKPIKSEKLRVVLEPGGGKRTTGPVPEPGAVRGNGPAAFFMKFVTWRSGRTM